MLSVALPNIPNLLISVIYLKKRCGAYDIFSLFGATLIRGWHLIRGGAY